MMDYDIFFKMNNLKLLIIIKAGSLILFNNFISLLSAQEIDSFISVHDRQEYKIVKLGSQWWMAENLKAIQFNDGKYISLVTNT